MDDQTPAVASCEMSEDMITKLMEAMGDSIRATMTDAFSLTTEIKPWTLSVAPSTVMQETAQAKVEIMSMTRHHYGSFVLRFERPVIEKIIHRYGEGRSDQAVYDDAVCEIANMIYGLFKATVNKMGCHLTMQLPAPYHPKQAADSSGADQKVVLPFVVDGMAAEAILMRAA